MSLTDQLPTKSGDAKVSLDKWLESKIKTINSQIAALEEKRKEKQVDQPVKLPAILDAGGAAGKNATTVVADGAELADPLFGIDTQLSGGASAGPGSAASTAPAAGTASDPWTTISASFTAEDQRSQASSSSWGMSVGGGAGWGLWSVGGSYAHDESKSDAQSDMASCDVSLTFDALVVNIERPWLYGELFNDYELDVADDILLSPGAQELHNLMKKQVPSSESPADVAAAEDYRSQLAQYNSFPAYPTSFIVAANTIVEVSFSLSNRRTMSHQGGSLAWLTRARNSSTATRSISRTTSARRPAPDRCRSAGARGASAAASTRRRSSSRTRCSRRRPGAGSRLARRRSLDGSARSCRPSRGSRRSNPWCRTMSPRGCRV